MNDFLKTIAEIKRAEVRAAKARLSERELRARCRDLPPARPFAAALRGDTIAVIAELKKASPSGGILCPAYDPASLARSYQAGGAAAISVLTERNFFQGDPEHIRMAKEAVRLPVLRKDFIIDEYQIYESKAAGADAILLIAELLEPNQLSAFLALASGLGLACLVEAHDRDELEKVIGSGAGIIGVNNRDLKTLTVNLETSFRLLPLIPSDRIRVSESGIKTASDIRRLKAAGAQAVLVGEALLGSGDISGKLKELREAN